MDKGYEDTQREDPTIVRPRTAAPKSYKVLQPALALVLSIALLAVLAYIYDSSRRFQRSATDEFAKLSSRLQSFEDRDQAREARVAGLESQLSEALKSVGATNKALEKNARQLQFETRRTKAELNDAIGSKADASQVEALKQEANTKFESVNSEVGGVKSDVVTVKTDLASTRRDLEGTQRQIVDVRETLSAAVARNSTELAALRAKGEREYFEFSVPKKNVATKVGDVSVVLTKTDPKKGKYNVKILADDNQLEKKDRTVNEPVQFLVGHNMVRYELVVNWVQKDRIGGYLSVPKDKSLAAERVMTAKSF